MKLKWLINSILKLLCFNSSIFIFAFTFYTTPQVLAQSDTIPNKYKIKIGVGIILPIYDFNSTIISPSNWPKDFIDKPFYNVIVPRDSTNASVKHIPFFTLNFKTGRYMHTIGYKSKTISAFQERNIQKASIKSVLIGYSVYRLFGGNKMQPYIGLGVNYYEKNWSQLKSYSTQLNNNYFLYEGLDTRMYSLQIPFGFQYTMLKNFGLGAEMGVNAVNFGYSNTFISRRPNNITIQQNFKYQKISFSAISFKFNYLIGIKSVNSEKHKSKLIKFNSYLANLKAPKFLEKSKIGLGIIIPVYDFNNTLITRSDEPTDYVDKPFYNVIIPFQSNKVLISILPLITLNFQYKQLIHTLGFKSVNILEKSDINIEATKIKSQLFTYRCYRLFGTHIIQPFLGLGLNYYVKSWQQPNRLYFKENSGFTWFVDEHYGLDSKIYSLLIPFGIRFSPLQNLSLSIETGFNAINYVKYSTYKKQYLNPTLAIQESRLFRPSISAFSLKINYLLNFNQQKIKKDTAQLKNEHKSKYIEKLKKLGINVGISAGINSYEGKYLSYFMFNHFPFTNYYNNVESPHIKAAITKSYFMQQQKKLRYNVDYFISFRNKVSLVISSKRILDERVIYNGVDISGKTQRHTLSAQYCLLSYNWNFKKLQFYTGARFDRYMYSFNGTFYEYIAPAYPHESKEKYEIEAKFFCFQTISGMRVFIHKDMFFDLGGFFNIYSFTKSYFKYEQKVTYYIPFYNNNENNYHEGSFKEHIFFNNIDKLTRNYLGLCAKIGFKI